MKRQARKLVVHRETLRRLSETRLADAAGGTAAQTNCAGCGTTGGATAATCDACVTTVPTTSRLSQLANCTLD